MPSAVIPKFGGIDRHSSDIDLSLEISRQCKNFSTTKKPNALSKAGSYADVATSLLGSTLPASITWKNFAEIPLTLPENRDIYIFHGQDGSSNHHLYVAKYWNGSAFVSGFLKLSESEGSYTSDAGTNGSQIVDSQLLSSVDDYYNGWTVTLNNTAAALAISAIVQDYNGTTKTLTFKTNALGGGGLAAAPGDTYYISRYPIFSTNATALGITYVDNIIRFLARENAIIGMTGNAEQFPNQYQLWYGYINRVYGDGSPSQTFNNFFLDMQQLPKPLLSSAITNRRGILQVIPQVGGSLPAGAWRFYAAFEFDDFQIGPLSDAYETALTVTASPNSSLRVYTELPINGGWFDTSVETGLTADVGTTASQIVDAGLASAVNDFYNQWVVIYNNAALATTQYAVVTDYDGGTKTLTFDTNARGVGATTGDTYAIRRDPLVDDSFIQCFDSNTIPLKYSPHILSRRITGIYYFVQAPGETEIKLINTDDFLDNNPLKIASADYTDNDFEFETNENYVAIAGTPRCLRFTSSPTGSTYLQLVGQTSVKTNFKYAVALDDHLIAAGIRTEDGERKNNNLLASVVDGSGVATPDNFGPANIINLGFYGSKEITGIKVIGDTPTTTSPKRRLLVATDDDVYILTLQTGETFDFALDRIGNKEGIVAPDSIVSAEGGIFAVSRNGFRLFTETGTQIIGEGLKDDFDALTNPAEAFGAYHKKYRLILWSFPTDQKYFAVDLLSKGLQMIEFSFADVIRILVGSRTGDLYSMSTAKIFQMESGTTQAGTAFTPLYRTKKIQAHDLFDEQVGFKAATDSDIIPTEGLIRYKSDTAITLNAYRNGGSAITFNNLSLPAQTTAQSRRFKFPLGLHCKDIEFEVTLAGSQIAGNSYLELDQLKILCEIRKRMD